MDTDKISYCITEDLLDMYYSNPNSRKFLVKLFPNIEEYSKPYIKVGILLKDKIRPNSIYTLVVIDEFVRIVNISANYAWRGFIPIKTLVIKPHHEDIGFNDIYLTKYEFTKLVSKSRIASFEIIKSK